MRLELWYPTKPYKINQGWGVYRPEIYSQFGFTRHNGVDYRLSWDGITRAELPCEVINIGWQPNGGGRFVTVKSRDKWSFLDGSEGYVMIDYLHLVKDGVMVKLGQTLEVGEGIAKQDNTGFSTGPHTHAQHRKVSKTLKNLEFNDANNTFDPEPYRNRFHAEDYQKVRNNLSTQVSILKQITSLINNLYERITNSR